jgi:hypothetical protein
MGTTNYDLPKFYHAYGGERGDNKYNQQPGDQLQQQGKRGEVIIGKSYINSDSPWTYIMRYNGGLDMCKKAAEIGGKLASSQLVGYAWDNRDTLYNQLKANNWDVDKFLNSGVMVDTDCSAFAYTVWCCLIPELRIGNNGIGWIPSSQNTDDTFLKSGKFSKITNPDALNNPKTWRIGDVLRKSGHVASVFCTETDYPAGSGYLIEGGSSGGSDEGGGSLSTTNTYSGGSSTYDPLEQHYGGNGQPNKVTRLSKARNRLSGSDPNVNTARKDDFSRLADTLIDATPSLGRNIHKSQEMYDSCILKGDQTSKKVIRGNGGSPTAPSEDGTSQDTNKQNAE